ncbi:hypothetical protein LQ948_15200 [Jiella sp. MQZ9-1]|uniref:Uncharacterized protein n=1 Tax=Jiella flava TaxID=2816857 RepID=A0A939JV97_9HYPH|nr:dimethylamine monooxygenase subunit DmmA family protein [Jiella flava]MBO0663980.1 hypothetical protein [Jiella flava]MCD2472551.1 hypothetical protein [Jiella flava]
MSEVKSRPKWGRLAVVPEAAAHLVCAEGVGLDAVAEAFGDHDAAQAAATVLLAGPTTAAQAGLTGTRVLSHPSRATAFTAFHAHLDRAKMGTAIYLAGSESFLNAASAIAEAHGVVREALQGEHRGARTRRVQCVHCKGIMEAVAVSPIVCSHCGVHLMVRDHYSRRLGAFMGVVVDAEAPGVLPQALRL